MHLAFLDDVTAAGVLRQDSEQLQFRRPGANLQQLARPARFARPAEATGHRGPQGPFHQHGYTHRTSPYAAGW